MSKSILYWIRWMLAIPAGIVAVLAISFILRLLFQQFFFHLSSAVIAGIVTVINAAVFVLACAFFAPGKDERKLNFVLLLFALVVGVFIFLNLTGVSILGFGIHFENGWLTLTLAIIGACVGFAVMPKNPRIEKEESTIVVKERAPSGQL